MNNTKILWTAVVVVAIISVFALFHSSSSSSVSQLVGNVASTTTNLPSFGLKQIVIGANCGDNYTGYKCNGTSIDPNGTLTQSGIYSTSTLTGATLQGQELDHTIISMQGTGNITAGTPITVGLPASTSIPYGILTNPGDEESIFWYNASTTLGANIFLTGGTGVILQTASSTGTTLEPEEIAASSTATLDCMRVPDTDVVCQISSFHW